MLKPLTRTYCFAMLLALLCFGTTAQAQNSRTVPFVADSLWQQPVTTLDGKPFPMELLKNKKVVVLLFLFPDCPIATKSSHQLREIIAKYQPEGVEFYGIFPNKYIKVDSIYSYERENNIHIPFLLDRDLHLTRYLDAKAVPTVYVITPDGKVHYSGMIDNMFYALGRRRAVINEFYLKDALAAVLAGKEPAKPQTEAIGCFIYATKQEERGQVR
jgi:peroxiredoxin